MIADDDDKLALNLTSYSHENCDLVILAGVAVHCRLSGQLPVPQPSSLDSPRL